MRTEADFAFNVFAKKKKNCSPSQTQMQSSFQQQALPNTSPWAFIWFSFLRCQKCSKLLQDLFWVSYRHVKRVLLEFYGILLCTISVLPVENQRFFCKANFHSKNQWVFFFLEHSTLRHLLSPLKIKARVHLRAVYPPLKVDIYANISGVHVSSNPKIYARNTNLCFVVFCNFFWVIFWFVWEQIVFLKGYVKFSEIRKFGD